MCMPEDGIQWTRIFLKQDVKGNLDSSGPGYGQVSGNTLIIES